MQLAICRTSRMKLFIFFFFLNLCISIFNTWYFNMGFGVPYTTITITNLLTAFLIFMLLRTAVPPPWQWQFTNLSVGYILHLRWPWQGQSLPPWRCCFRPPGCCVQPNLCGCSCAVPGKTSRLPPDTHKTSQVWGSLHCQPADAVMQLF